MNQRKQVIGICILVCLIALAFVAPLLSSGSTSSIDLEAINQPPSLLHWFGTDNLGRDLFIRVCYGIQLSLFIATAAALIDCTIGTLWGIAAGMFGGLTEETLMRITDILTVIPSTIAAIVLLSILGPGMHTLILALVATGWITMSRIMQSHTRTLISKEYIVASRLMGGGFWHVLWHHILPNCTRLILTTMLVTIPHAIFLESFLSFLGLGVSPPSASLGTLAYEGLPALGYYPWRMIIPSTCISLLVLSFNLILEGEDNEKDLIKV